jgi:hypothetical protein
MTLLLAGTFLGTFVVVSAIAYFLLRERAADSKSVAARHGAHDAQPSAGGQTMRDGSVLAYRVLQWFRDRPADEAPEPPAMRGPMTAWTVAAAVLVIIIAVLIFLGVIALGLKVFEYGVEPVFKRALGPLLLLLFVPGVLPAVAVAVLAIGLPLSQRFRPQGRFIAGVCAVAFGFMSLWQFPRLMGALPTPESRVQLEAPLLIVGLVVSAFLVVCGFQLMGRCKWTRKGDGGDDD